MAGRRPQQTRSVSSLTTAAVQDEATQRVLDQITAAIQKLQTGRSRDVKLVDLVVGRNVVRHGLGRDVVGYTLTVTAADATFAHAIDTTNTNPELEVWITVVGVAQPGARVEVF